MLIVKVVETGKGVRHTFYSPPFRASLALISRLEPRLLPLLSRLFLTVIPRRCPAYLLRAHGPRRLCVISGVVCWAKGRAAGSLFLGGGRVRERALTLGEVLFSARGSVWGFLTLWEIIGG